jgi:hypothetical protein
MTTVKWSFNYYLGFGNTGSPSVMVLLVSVFFVVGISSAVQEFKDRHTKLNKSSFIKNLVFIKNHLKN